MNVPLTPIRFLRYAEEQFPNKTAVVCRNERFSYSQFADRVSRLAGALNNIGIESGDRVAFLSINCHCLLEAYYGVLDADAVLLPLNVRLAPSEIAFILRDASPKVLFLEKVFLPLVELFRHDVGVETFILMDDKPAASWLFPQSYEDLIANAPAHRSDIMKVNENALAELFYTSGTSANKRRNAESQKYLSARTQWMSHLRCHARTCASAHDSFIPREWVGIGPRNHVHRRQTRNDPAVGLRRDVSADRAGTRHRMRPGSHDGYRAR